MSTDNFEILLPSALFPFRLDDLAKFNYGPYTLKNVFQSITSEQRQACVEMWLQHGAVSSAEAAWKRSEEVCYYVTETTSGKLVGVNTLYVGRYGVANERFLFNRMFIDPAYRNSRLMVIGTAMMLCYAKTHLDKHGIVGVLSINENKKLARRGASQVFAQHGYRKIAEQDGCDVWLFEFDKIVILEA